MANSSDGSCASNLRNREFSGVVLQRPISVEQMLELCLHVQTLHPCTRLHDTIHQAVILAEAGAHRVRAHTQHSFPLHRVASSKVKYAAQSHGTCRKESTPHLAVSHPNWIFGGVLKQYIQANKSRSPLLSSDWPPRGQYGAISCGSLARLDSQIPRIVEQHSRQLSPFLAVGAKVNGHILVKELLGPLAFKSIVVGQHVHQEAEERPDRLGRFACAASSADASGRDPSSELSGGRIWVGQEPGQPG